MEHWVPGDVVEVLDNFSWKLATISKVSGKRYFVVRLLGSSLEIKVSKSNIRLRQSWKDEEWKVMTEVLSSSYSLFISCKIFICECVILGLFSIELVVLQ